MPLRVESDAFTEGGDIPVKHTCDGSNISPPLRWSAVPAETKSIALICEDPDAPNGVFTHWVLYDLPPDTSHLPEGFGGGTPGLNSFKKPGYGGPCPPPNGAHRYMFQVYALNIASLGAPGLSRKDAIAAMHGHVLDEGELFGRYRRRRS